MCTDCDDSSIVSIPTGPQGPSGPAGPSPTLIGTSTTTISLGTGTVSFSALPTDLSWGIGQRIRASNSDTSKILEGELLSYSGDTASIDVDYIEGSGSDSNWTLGITGARGATGITGATGSTGTDGASGKNSYGTSSAIATSLGSHLYTLPLTNTGWGVVGETIYVGTAGYYQITAISAGVNFTVLDLQYSGNVPANMVASSGLGITPGGIKGDKGDKGDTGSTGSAGPTGATGPIASFTEMSIASTSIPDVTNLDTITGDVSKDKILTFQGYIDVRSTVAVNITIKPTISSVEIDSLREIIVTSPTEISSKSNISIPVCGRITLNAGQIFGFNISLNDYTHTTTARIRLLYMFE